MKAMTVYRTIPRLALFLAFILSVTPSALCTVSEVAKLGGNTTSNVIGNYAVYSLKDSPWGHTEPMITVGYKGRLTVPEDVLDADPSMDNTSFVLLIFPQGEGKDENGTKFRCCQQIEGTVSDEEYTRRCMAWDDVAVEPSAYMFKDYTSLPYEPGWMDRRKVARYPVNVTGYHTVLFVKCSVERWTMNIEMDITVMNPYGQLPPTRYVSMKGHLVLAFLYLALLAGWSVLCIMFRGDILPLQLWLGGVMIASMATEFFNYGYLSAMNGGDTAGGMKWVSIFAATGMYTLLLFVVLVICMGYGVARPTLAGVKYPIVIVMVVHAIVKLLHESIVTTVYERDQTSFYTRSAVSTLYAFSLYFISAWMYVSLNDTIHYLSKHKQSRKLAMFGKLLGIIICSIIVATLFFIVFLLFSRFGNETDWVSRGVLDLQLVLGFTLFFAFAAISWVWRPTANNKLYSLSLELGQEMDEFDSSTDYGSGNDSESFPLGDDDDVIDNRNNFGSAPTRDSRSINMNGGVLEDDVAFTLEGADDSDLE